jgi:hypothetical protein
MRSHSATPSGTVVAIEGTTPTQIRVGDGALAVRFAHQVLQA